jgi:hypothetical protein
MCIMQQQQQQLIKLQPCDCHQRRLALLCSSSLIAWTHPGS